MLKKINVPENPMVQPYPLFIYYRFQFLAGETIKYFNYQIDYKYYYNLISLLAKIPYKNSVGNNLYCIAKIDARSMDRNRVLNNTAYDVKLIASPGDNAIISPAPSPVDSTAFNVNMSGDPFKNTLKLNEMYLFRSSIFFSVTLDRVLANDTYIDILARGYNVPENYYTDYSN